MRFHVSPSSIANDLEKIDENYSIKIISSKRGTRIKGTEEDIQRNLFRYCENVLSHKGINNEQLFMIQMIV
ncbi:hypothetical protein [Alkalibaculum bacchi]|uniref:hypothetical protein n=1 Tax=Alkalibaculum bacchi TaxID=645887 RepID=UPI000DEA06BF|nr:hypothetical protein [Alkalibaculum bacchi]